jgi:uncharacterized membrane protein YkoI
MKKPNIRSKRVIVPGIALVAALAVGGTVWTATANDDLGGDERDRVGQAAVEAAGGGTVVDVESSDDRGEAYEVELRAEDGSEREVVLDEQLDVVTDRSDDADDDRGDADDDADDDTDDRDEADDRVLGADERTAAEEAALEAVGGGTVLDVEGSDDRGEAYEVSVRDAEGTEWDVELDSGYDVLRKTVDN